MVIEASLIDTSCNQNELNDLGLNFVDTSVRTDNSRLFGALAPLGGEILS